MEPIILVVHVLLAIGLIALILMQHGKGADAGAAFGSGSSGTVFGASGSASFLTKLTTWIAIAFFATSLGLAYIAANADKATSVFDRVVEETAPEQGVAEDIPSIGEEPTADIPVEASTVAEEAAAVVEENAPEAEVPAQ